MTFEQAEAKSQRAQGRPQLMRCNCEKIIADAHSSLGFLVAQTFTEIGNNHPDSRAFFKIDRIERELRRNARARVGHHHHLRPGRLLPALPDETTQQITPFSGHELCEFIAHDLLQRPCDHTGESGVAVKDHARRGQRDGALVHSLDDYAIRMLRAFQCENLLTGRSGHDQRIDVPRADRVEGFLRLVKALSQFFDLKPYRRVLTQLHFHPAIARLRRTLDRSEKSPTIRRTGNGSSFIRVGAAMMLDSVARPGC